MSLPGRWRWCDRPWLCDARKEQNALHTLIHQRRLRHHAEGSPLPRREQWTRQGYSRRVPELENSQGLTRQNLQTFQEFPPRQKPDSFSIDQAMEKLMNQKSSN
jgi:hypothetical protein